MDCLKMLSVSALLMAMVFPITASAGDPADRFHERKKQSIDQNIKGKAGGGYSTLKTTKSHGRTIVRGTVVNRMNKTVTGKDAVATGSEINVDGEGGNVYVRGNVINRGDVTAVGKDTATATGAGVTVKNARSSNIGANVHNTGKVTSIASGSKKVESSATGAKINVENGTARIRGNVSSNAAITAISKSK